MTEPAGAVRVVFVCASGPRGPSEKQVLGYAERLLALGHAVAMAVPEALPEDFEPPAGLDMVAYRVTRRGLDQHARAVLGRFAPNVIHAFSPRLRPIVAARSLSKITGCPVAVHFEDDEWGLARGFASDSLARRAGRRLAGCGAPLRPNLWPYATAGSLRFAATDAVAVDAVAPELAREVQRRLGRPCTTLMPTLPGAMTTGAARRAPALPGISARLVAYTGSVFGPHLEDFELLLAAIAELQRRGHDVALVHAGQVAPRFDGPRLARRAGLTAGSAHFLGYVDEPELVSLLRQADVLVQPGRPSDFNRLRLPSKLQAYLASGTPTVTFACGFGELLEDRVEVLKTYGPGPAELAERIGEVLSDQTLAARLRAGGPAAAARLFDQARNTDMLLGYYANIRATTSR